MATDPDPAACGAPPSVFSHPTCLPVVLEDTLAELHALWRAAGCGIDIGEETLCCLWWADDTCILATRPEELEFMVNSLVQTAQRRAGLEFGLPKSTRTQQPDAEVPEACESLRAMKQAPTTGTLRYLGALVQPDGEHQLE